MSNKASSAGGGADKPQPTAKKKPTKKKPVTTKGSQTPDLVKAEIIAAFLCGEYTTNKQIAEAVGTSQKNVGRVIELIPAKYLTQVDVKKENRIAEKVEEFLTGTLDSLAAINAVTSEHDWIRKQDAAGLTIFFGTKADKVAKILEAIERANQPEPNEIPATEGSQA